MQLKGVIRYLIIALFSSILVTTGSAVVFGTSRARDDAYRAVTTFLPINILVAYYDIITMPTSDAATFPSLRPYDPIPDFEQGNTGHTTSFSLTRDAKWGIRPLTAIIDLVVHAFADSGLIGGLFTLAQLVLGLGVVLYLGRNKEHGFYYYVMGVPLLTVVAAAFVTIPLWLIAYIAELTLGSSVGLAVHGTATVFSLCWVWVRDRLIEKTVHEGVAEVVDQVADRAKEVFK